MISRRTVGPSNAYVYTLLAYILTETRPDVTNRFGLLYLWYRRLLFRFLERPGGRRRHSEEREDVTFGQHPSHSRALDFVRGCHVVEGK
jgi:hypothetical protein